jgi:neutral ceramidase
MTCATRWIRTLSPRAALAALTTLASLAAIVAMAPTTCRAADSPAWKAGIAAAKITPKEPLWMAGYAARTRPAEGTCNDLWVRVLALEAADGGRVVFIATDLVGFTKAIADRVCTDVMRRTGIERSRIMLTCTHTHSGPVLDDALFDIYPLDDRQRAMIRKYTQWLEATIAATSVEALGKLAPATLWAGESTVDFGANRRNNPEPAAIASPAERAKYRGPIDHAVPVLAVRKPGGELAAVVFGYACHNTTLSFYQWCGDYAGFAQDELEKQHPGAAAMFAMGCGADQNPMPRRIVEHARHFGRQLADAVAGTLGRPMRPLSSQCRVAFRCVDLPFGPAPPLERLDQQSRTPNYIGRWAARTAQRIRKGETLERSYPYPVQAWMLGDQLWIALGGEVVVDYALDLKARYGAKTWIAGYANDVMAYIPSQRVLKEGGYEAGAFSVYGLPADGWAPEVQDRVLKTVEQVRKALR